MKEIFKDIPNYEGLYQVSNLGRIKSLAEATKLNNIKSLSNISLCCNGKYKQAHGYIWKYKEVV